MDIIVAGCGKIGKSIIKSMLKENHNVTVIDIDRNVVSSMTDTLDVLGIVGNCTSYDVLKDAGVKSADLFIAVTGVDELNMLSCYVAKKWVLNTPLLEREITNTIVKALTLLRTNLNFQ